MTASITGAPDTSRSAVEEGSEASALDHHRQPLDMDDALKRAHAQLAEGQRLSKTGSFTADLRLDRHEWSDEYYRIFEIDPALGASTALSRQRVHPDDLAEFDAQIQRGVEGGGDADFVFRIVTPVGGLKYLGGVARIVEHVAGRPILMGTVQDITESKAREEGLAASEAYLRQAQRMTKTGSFSWPKGDFEPIFSEELRRIFGFEGDEIVTLEAAMERIHPDELAHVASQIQAAREGVEFDYVVRLRMPDGAIKFTRHVAHGYRDQNGRSELIGSVQDITETKLAEDALEAQASELRRTHAHLTEAQRLSKTGSFEWDVLADTHHWSGEVRRIYGFEEGVPITMGMIFTGIHPEDQPYVERMVQGAAEGRDFDIVFRVVTPDGEIRYANIVGHRMKEYPDRPVFAGAFQDITAGKLAEERLDRARRELAHVSRLTALSTLTASIAHEVNQPLAGIVANASTCLRLLAADPPNAEGAQVAAQRMIRDANRASEVIKRLRALFARRPPASEPLDLNEAAREVLALASVELESAQVRVRTDLADLLPLIVGDRVQLQQVILNLVLNGADALRSVSGRERVLELSTDRSSDGEVLLHVRDNGVGASEEALARFFDAFYTTKPEGMGVGLSISRSILDAHGGRIRASANDGPGLTLVVAIPASGDDADPSPVGSAAIQNVGDHG